MKKERIILKSLDGERVVSIEEALKLLEKKAINPYTLYSIEGQSKVEMISNLPNRLKELDKKKDKIEITREKEILTLSEKREVFISEDGEKTTDRTDIDFFREKDKEKESYKPVEGLRYESHQFEEVAKYKREKKRFKSKYAIAIGLILIFLFGFTLIITKKIKEENHWKKAEKIGTVNAYNNYLEKYPDGKYITLAKKKKNYLIKIKHKIEENKRKDEGYKRYYTSAKNSFYLGKYRKALTEILTAKKFKNTSELKSFEKQVKEKINELISQTSKEYNKAKISEIPISSVWIFPDSNKRYLTDEYLKNLSIGELWKARNEIFARRGYIFHTKRGKAFAKSLGKYYKGTEANGEKIYMKFNRYEKYNITLIQKYEKKK